MDRTRTSYNSLIWKLLLAIFLVAGCASRGNSPPPSSGAPPVVVSSVPPAPAPVPVSQHRDLEAKRPEHQCNRLIQAINEEGKLISSALDDFAAKRDMPGLERRILGSATRMESMVLADPALKAFANRYHSMLLDLVAAAHHAVDKNAEIARRGVSELDKVTATEDRLVDEVNVYCGLESPKGPKEG
ncbi:MAG: hypothetical protein HY898_04095 [Deltaproteobacteria bacterium]|nr:hypothetical protein [Deltaproteobacteria bacterium]